MAVGCRYFLLCLQVPPNLRASLLFVQYQIVLLGEAACSMPQDWLQRMTCHPNNLGWWHSTHECVVWM